MKNFNTGYVLILDTEGYSNCPLYNVGWCVLNLETLKIVEKFSGAVPEYLADNLSEKNKRLLSTNPANEKLADMLFNNLQDILRGFGSGKYEYVKSEWALYCRLKAVIRKYQIHDVFAFNFPFDRGAFGRTFKESRFKMLDKALNFHDIQTSAFYTFCNNMSYVEWCIVNGYVTDKGNIQTTAEVIYRYITKKMDFKEEHTALSDTIIETEILIECLKKCREIETKHISPYAILNKLFENTEENREKILLNYLFGEPFNE